MSTLEELGKLAKLKYPGKYDDIPDRQLGVLIKAQYPNSYNDFTDDIQTPPKIESLVSHYHPQKGTFTAWWSAIKSKKRTELAQQLNQEQLAVIEHGMMYERAALEGKKNASEIEAFVKTNQHILFELQAKEYLIRQAAVLGRTHELHQELIREEELSRIKTDEHARLKEIDLEARWREILQDSNAADLAQIGDHLVVKKLRAELMEARRERYAVKSGDDPEELKQELLADYDKFISRLEAKIDERETGHLLSEDREAPKRLTQGKAESRAEYPPETDEDYE